MTRSINFYFDFISPYSFLAYKKLKSLNKNNEINVNYKPILLGGLHKLSGIVAPAFNDSKKKKKKNDCELIAAKNDIKFSFLFKIFYIYFNKFTYSVIKSFIDHIFCSINA